MKLILNNILVWSLAFSLSLGAGIFSHPVSSHARAPVQSKTEAPIMVVSQPLAVPPMSMAQPTMACQNSTATINNLVQTTGVVNLNQLADCFSIQLAVPKLPALAIAPTLVLPDLAVAQGPDWTSNQVRAADTQPVAAALAINFVFAVLLWGSWRVVKRSAVATHQALTFSNQLALSQLQMFRC